ncbi:Protein transport protein SEC31 homolog B, partial [Linum perenne]
PAEALQTHAGAVDLSFSSSANIEIFKLDFQSEDPDLPLVGELQSIERFNRIAWGKNGSGSEQYGLGLIVGGLVDGTISIDGGASSAAAARVVRFRRRRRLGSWVNLFGFSVRLFNWVGLIIGWVLGLILGR